MLKLRFTKSGQARYYNGKKRVSTKEATELKRKGGVMFGILGVAKCVKKPGAKRRMKTYSMVKKGVNTKKSCEKPITKTTGIKKST